MLTTYCRELASMAGTLRGLLEHARRRGLPLGPDREALAELVAPTDALRAQIAVALGLPATHPLEHGDASGSAGDPLHALGSMQCDLRGIRMSLDEVFDDGGFQQEGPRPFRRLVVEDLRNTFGVPVVVGEDEQPKRPLSLALRDGTPAARRASVQPDIPDEGPRPSTPEEMLELLRQNYDDVDVTMEGTTESLPIQTVFESLSATRKSGTLHIRTERETLVFELDGGDVVFAASDSTPAGDRLGDILFERGWVTATSLNAALGAQMDGQERLGTALEREQIVTRDQLRQALEEQIHRHFLRAFQSPSAAYAFARGNSEDVDQRVRLNIARLLFESARVSDESSRAHSVSND